MRMITAVILDEHDTLSFVEVCEQLNVAHDDLLRLLEHGIAGHSSLIHEQMQFNHTMLTRIQTAIRLQRDLGINEPGAALALDLLDELTEIRETLRILQRHVDV